MVAPQSSGAHNEAWKQIIPWCQGVLVVLDNEEDNRAHNELNSGSLLPLFQHYAPECWYNPEGRGKCSQ